MKAYNKKKRPKHSCFMKYVDEYQKDNRKNTSKFNSECYHEEVFMNFGNCGTVFYRCFAVRKFEKCIITKSFSIGLKKFVKIERNFHKNYNIEGRILLSYIQSRIKTKRNLKLKNINLNKE